MNKDQVKGAAKHISGEVKQEVGKLTGDTGTRVRGHAQEAEGKLQKKVGDSREALRHDQSELDRRRGLPERRR